MRRVLLLIVFFTIMALGQLQGGNPFGHPIGHGCFIGGSRLTNEWIVCRPD